MINIDKLFTTLNYVSTEYDKYQALKEFFEKATPGEVELFREYINPNSVSFIGKAVLEKTIPVANNFLNTVNDDDLLSCYKNLKNRAFTGNDAIKYLDNHLCRLSVISRESFEAILIKKPLGISYKTVNKFYKKYRGSDFISVFGVQLANKYVVGKNYAAPYFFMSPKLDGLRCYYSNERKGLYTRTNKVHKGFLEIQQICDNLCSNFNLSVIDGELFTDTQNFEKLNGIIRCADSDLKDKVVLIIFAVIPQQQFVNGTSEMVYLMDKIQDRLTKLNIKRVSVLRNLIVKNDAEVIKNETICLVKKGFEGLMLRDPFKPYDFKRSDALMKVKLFKEDDFIVTDYFEGNGKYKGMLGGFAVKKGEIESEVGTGLSDQDRKHFWEIRDSLIGKTVNIKYFSLTDSGKSLRHPVFLKFK
jgi:DNA ligase 1